MRMISMLLATIVGFAFAATAQDVSVTIEEIVPNRIISGRVTGISPGVREKYKIVVYVRTDQWYIHPFTSGGAGKSYAVVTASGDWTIETVRRGFSAHAIAALVVRRSDDVPTRTHNIAKIRSIARVVRQLGGTPDYGKL